LGCHPTRATLTRTACANLEIIISDKVAQQFRRRGNPTFGFAPYGKRVANAASGAPSRARVPTGPMRTQVGTGIGAIQTRSVYAERIRYKRGSLCHDYSRQRGGLDERPHGPAPARPPRCRSTLSTAPVRAAGPTRGRQPQRARLRARDAVARTIWQARSHSALRGNTCGLHLARVC
jgi:hypothetical protein